MAQENLFYASLEKLNVFYIKPNEYRPGKIQSVTTYKEGVIPAKLLMFPILRVQIQQEQIKVVFSQANKGSTKILIGRSPEVSKFEESQSHVIEQGQTWDISLSRKNGAIMVFDEPYDGVGAATACMIAARENQS